MQRRRSASPTDLEELTVDDRAHYKGSFPYSKGCLGAFADMSSVVCRGARRKARANRVFQDCGGGRIFGGTELLFFLNGKARVERAPPLVCVCVCRPGLMHGDTSPQQGAASARGATRAAAVVGGRRQTRPASCEKGGRQRTVPTH